MAPRLMPHLDLKTLGYLLCLYHYQRFKELQLFSSYLDVVNVLTNFPFSTSETMRGYYLANMVYTSFFTSCGTI